MRNTNITTYRCRKCPPVSYLIFSNIAAILIYIYTRDGLPWVCTFQYLLYFWLNEVDESISGVFNGTNQPEKMIHKERQDPAIDFCNNLSPELVINYFIKRVGLSSRSLRAAASGEDHTPPGIDGIRWQPLVAGLGEKLSRQGSDTYYCHFMHENTEIIGINESISFLLKNDNYF